MEFKLVSNKADSVVPRTSSYIKWWDTTKQSGLCLLPRGAHGRQQHDGGGGSPPPMLSLLLKSVTFTAWFGRVCKTLGVWGGNSVTTLRGNTQS